MPGFVPFMAAGRRERPDDRSPNVVATVLLLVPVVAGLALTARFENPIPAVVGVIIGVVAMQSPKIAQQWERASAR